MLTWLDVIILTIITVSSILGTYEGLVKLVLGLLGFILSIIMTYYLYPLTSIISVKYFADSITLAITSGIISYIISLIICSLLMRKLFRLVAIMSGGVSDRSLGLIVGGIRGTIISLGIFAIIAICFSGSYLHAKTVGEMVKNTSSDKYPKWLKNSVTTPYLTELSEYIITTEAFKKFASLKITTKTENDDHNGVIKKPHQDKIPENEEPKFPEDFTKQLNEIIHEKNDEKNDNSP